MGVPQGWPDLTGGHELVRDDAGFEQHSEQDEIATSRRYCRRSVRVARCPRAVASTVHVPGALSRMTAPVAQ